MTDLLTAIQTKRDRTAPTREEEADMLALAQNGDKNAIEQLIRNYVGLLINEVNRVVKGANGAGVGDSSVRDDVISTGILAFMRAVTEWDPARGRFQGFVVRVLRTDPEFTNVLNQVQVLPVPKTTLVRRSQVMAAAGGDLIKAREISPQFGLTRETFDAVSSVFNGPQALATGSDDDTIRGGNVPAEYRHVDPGYVRLEHLQDAARALTALDPVDRLVVESYYGLNGQPEMSQYEIADRTGMTRQAVRKRLAKAHTKMQAAMAAEKETA